MKIVSIILLLLIYNTTTFSQNTKSKNSDQYFVVLYTLGESWDTTKQVHEQAYFNEHSTYLSELRKAKKISIGGRYSDTGMILIKAKNRTEAQDLITKDIAVQNKLFKVEIFLFNPFYTGCVK